MTRVATMRRVKLPPDPTPACLVREQSPQSFKERLLRYGNHPAVTPHVLCATAVLEPGENDCSHLVTGAQSAPKVQAGFDKSKEKFWFYREIQSARVTPLFYATWTPTFAKTRGRLVLPNLHVQIKKFQIPITKKKRKNTQKIVRPAHGPLTVTAREQRDDYVSFLRPPVAESRSKR